MKVLEAQIPPGFPFLQSFLNIQSNDFLAGAEILLLGHFDFGDIQYAIENNAQGTDEKTGSLPACGEHYR